MSDFMTAPSGAENYRSTEMKDSIPDPIELKTEDELVIFWATFWRNNGFNSEGDVDRKERELKQAKDTVVKIKSEEGVHHFFGIIDDKKMIATGKVEIKIDKQGIKHGYLDCLTVDEEFRGKGVAKKITDVCSDYAKKEGCLYLDGDVNVDSPAALVTKFNDGYLLTGLELFGDYEPELGLFYISKNLDGVEKTFDKKKGPVGNLIEVNLSDLKTINDLLLQGYVGIDVKNIGTKKDENPKNWVLILEGNI